ncbi:hypothetical protein CEXT_595861 [Caerostris extrusa]|uniref:Uncharacterized protein n=1 Tax=Caerostris extrusa TaxID=172846 RepID=A0AAV4XZT4_CAEEX|nr:hypothetical protein CEXT_595861 [Caerostris extrusa]
MSPRRSCEEDEFCLGRPSGIPMQSDEGRGPREGELADDDDQCTRSILWEDEEKRCSDDPLIRCRGRWLHTSKSSLPE